MPVMLDKFLNKDKTIGQAYAQRFSDISVYKFNMAVYYIYVYLTKVR